MRRVQKFGLGMVLMALAVVTQAGTLDEVTIDVIERGDEMGNQIIQRIELPVPTQEKGASELEPEQPPQEIRDVIRQGSDLRRLRSDSMREKAARP